jgi:hypothetical protein
VSPPRKVLAVIAIVVAVAIAYIVVNRSREKPTDQVAATDTTPSEPAELRIGARFPNVNLIADRDTLGVTPHIGVRDVIAGREALVLFLAPNCEPCNATVKRWSEYLAKAPSDVKVFAVINAAPEERDAYHVVTDAMFPIYSDSTGTFSRDYGVAIYPTVVGIDASGNVVFVKNTIDSTLTPRVAAELLRAPSNR